MQDSLLTLLRKLKKSSRMFFICMNTAIITTSILLKLLNYYNHANHRISSYFVAHVY